MRNLSDEKYRAFMTHGTRTAKAATTRSDGRPHITPIWFVLDGDDLIFTTHETLLKAIDLRRDPRVCLCVDDETPPFADVMFERTVTLSEEVDELRRWATAIGGRYMGSERAEEFGKRNGFPGELLARVSPTKLLARVDIAGN